MILNKKRNDFLKLVGALAMMVDHVGKGLVASNLIYVAIGRLSFPIFAFGLVEGFFHTSNVKKYLQRLFIFALVAQIPYSLYFQTFELNVIFLFFISLLVICNVERFITTPRPSLKQGGEYYSPPQMRRGAGWFELANKKLLLVIYLIIIFIFIYFIPVDFGFKGLLIILAFYFFRGQTLKLLIVQGLIIAGFTFGQIYDNVFLLGGVLVVLYFNKDYVRINLGRYFFYWFYPGHLLVLYLVKMLL